MNNLNNNDDVSNWGIIELMGRKVVAGLISKSVLLGPPMLRVDVPATSAFGEFTQFYGETAIYCVTFVSEQVARLTAEQNKVNPVSVYVPDLITREQHEKMLKSYSDQIEKLRQARLPAGSAGESAHSAPGEDDGRWGNEDDEDDDHDEF